MLVVTPAPEARESMTGYAIRLAEANGYSSPGTILCYAGYKSASQLGVNCDLTLLAGAVGRDANDLSEVSYGDVRGGNDKRAVYRGHEVSSWRIARVLSPKRSAFCPSCIRECGYIDSYWDLTLATVCPKHRCKSVRRCSTCKKTMSWLRPGLLKCRCGAEVEDFSVKKALVCEVELLGLAQSKLQNEIASDPPNRSRFPIADLRKMTFVQLMSVLFLLGQHLQRFSHTEALESPDSVLEVAARSLRNWPSDFHKSLRDLGETNASGEQLSILRIQFGPLYRSLSGEKLLSQASRFILDEIETFLGVEKSGAILRDRRLIETPNTRLPKSLSVEWICSQFAFSPKRIEGWCRFNSKNAAGLMPADLRAFVVESEIVSHLKVGKEHRITERKAAAMASLPVSVMYELRELGYVEGPSGPTMPLGYRASSIESLVSRLRAVGDRISNTLVDPSVHVSFSKVLETATFWSHFGKAKFAIDVLERRVRSFGRTGDVPQLLYLEKAVVNDYIEAERATTAKGLLTLTEAGQRIGVSSDCVAVLASLTHLTIQAGPYHRSICEKSVHEFSEVYVTLNDLAVKMNSSSMAMRRRAEKRKLKLLTVTSSRGVKTFFLRRSDVESFVSEMIMANKKANERLQAWHKQNDTADKLQRYLKKLRSSGEALPRVGRKPNFRRIADACGFNRNAFYNNKSLRETMLSFDLEDAKRCGIDRNTDLEILGRYLESRKKLGKPIPTIRKQRVNKKAIALEAGIDRNIFYKSDEAENLIMHFLVGESELSCG